MAHQRLSDRLWQFAARIAKVVESSDDQWQILNGQFSIQKSELLKFTPTTGLTQKSEMHRSSP